MCIRDSTLYRIFAVQEIKASFRKREFILKYIENPSYPQYIKFELIQDRCDLIEIGGYTEGDEVEVTFSIEGREWTNPKGEVQYFNSLKAFRIDRAGGGNKSANTNNSQQSASKNTRPQHTSNNSASESLSTNVSSNTAEMEDDLPF
jgi:hypothetical protein